MAGNSFETHDGSHVGGVVAMAIDKNGQAVPVDVTPTFTLEQLCRALAAHAVACRLGPDDENEAAAKILNFARGQQKEDTQ